MRPSKTSHFLFLQPNLAASRSLCSSHRELHAILNTFHSIPCLFPHVILFSWKALPCLEWSNFYSFIKAHLSHHFFQEPSLDLTPSKSASVLLLCLHTPCVLFYSPSYLTLNWCIVLSIPLLSCKLFKMNVYRWHLCTHLAHGGQSVNLLKLKCMNTRYIISLIFEKQTQTSFGVTPSSYYYCNLPLPLRDKFMQRVICSRSPLPFLPSSPASVSSPLPPWKQLSSRLPNPVGNSRTSYYLISDALSWFLSNLIVIPSQLILLSLLIFQICECYKFSALGPPLYLHLFLWGSLVQLHSFKSNVHPANPHINICSQALPRNTDSVIQLPTQQLYPDI